MGLGRASFTLILALSLCSCTRSNKSAFAATAVTVNGEKLSAGAFATVLGRKLKNYDALAAKDAANIRRARESIIQEFIVSSLLREYAKAHDISVSQAEVDREFDRARKTYPDDLTFKAALASEGQGLEEWQRALRKTLLERKVFGALESSEEKSPKTAESEARRYYDTHKGEFDRPAAVHIQQIVVAKEDDAERLLHKIKTGASFSDLAKHFSVSPDGAQGGDIGYVTKGTLPAFDAVFNFRPGQMSGVIKSSYGFHIIKVLDKKSAGVDAFEKVRGRLMRQVLATRQQARFNKWLEEAIRGAKIERNDALLDKIKIRTEGAGE